jgi:MFS transporter, AAHS family, 4-hydroxybenzoate transporter
MLFRGRLAMITPLLWIAYFFCTMSAAFIVTWVLALGESLGIAPSYAALAVSIGGLGLIVASLLLMPFLDRYGFIVVWPLPLISLPAYAILGLHHVFNMEFVALLVLIGFAGGGAQSGLHSTVGQFYPDECRGTGISWAVVMSRFGAVLGPIGAGAILSKGFSAQTVFLVMAIPVLLFSICALGLGVLHSRMRSGVHGHGAPLATKELSSVA